MSTTPHVFVPKPDELDLEFYQAIVSANRLCLQRCSDCATYTHPPRYFCPRCSCAKFSFEPVSGAGTVYSYTVSHVSAEPAWQPFLPYLTIVVELAEGPRIIATARGIRSEDVQIGMPVRVAVEKKSDEFAIFWAEPAQA